MHEDEDEVELPTSVPGGNAHFVGIFAGVVPFLLSYRTMQTVDGQVTSYLDYVAVGGGAVALLLGGLGLFAALGTTDASRNKRLGFAALAGVLGAVQLARGVGLF